MDNDFFFSLVKNKENDWRNSAIDTRKLIIYFRKQKFFWVTFTPLFHDEQRQCFGLCGHEGKRHTLPFYWVAITYS